MVHRLTAILSGDEEVFLGEFDNLYEAVKAAEEDHMSQTTFRICEGENCIVGVRMGVNITETFWRLPRNGDNQRGRDDRVMKVLDKVISIFKRS